MNFKGMVRFLTDKDKDGEQHYTFKALAITTGIAQSTLWRIAQGKAIEPRYSDALRLEKVYLETQDKIHEAA